jgi:penicillin-binding protein 1A
MSEGQGASMALPIWGLYMSKVYADKTLPYSQDEVFDLPEDYDPCRKANRMEEPVIGGFDELFQ